MKIGYQKGVVGADLDRQSELLMGSFGVDLIITDFKPIGYKNLDFFYRRINEMQRGTTIIVESLGYIVSNVDELTYLFSQLKDKGLRILAINETYTNCVSFGRATSEIITGALQLVKNHETRELDKEAVLLVQKGLYKINKCLR